jgi:hypothetical protein
VIRRRRAVAAFIATACVAAGLGLLGVAASAAACELRLTDHRSGRALVALPLDASAPELRVALEHSVLGTTVIDRYRFVPRAVLVEEEFEGEGYGLPHAAGPGERLERVGQRMRLSLARVVDPLVIRALPAQRMRLLLPDRELLLGTLGADSVLIEAHGCAPTAPPSPTRP